MNPDKVAAALARSDRYLIDFVERHALCPWARHCRESGGLERRVWLGPVVSADDLVPWLVELAGRSFEHVEVALLIFPDELRTSLEWDHFVAQLREAVRRAGHPETFFCVPFHPQSPAHADRPDRTVSLLRRSPDPTIQLVRAGLLDRVRGKDSTQTVFVDRRTIDLAHPLMEPPQSASERIAQDNFEAVQRIGVDSVLKQLDGIRSLR